MSMYKFNFNIKQNSIKNINVKQNKLNVNIKQNKLNNFREFILIG